MKPKICVILSPQGLETVRIIASNEAEEAAGEKLLAAIQNDLDGLHGKCVSTQRERAGDGN